MLNSLPGTLRTLYLDFDGDSTEEWNDESPGVTPRYDEDGNPGSFSETELEGIREIWARVAEKFSPFPLNVTTFYPGPLVNGVQGRIVIGGQGMWHDNGTTGGTTLPNGFFDDDLSNTGWVFSRALSGRKAVAEAIAHEFGHLLGLHHQSQYYLGAIQSAEYHPGDADRAPIMGNSYNAARGLWWLGDTGFFPVEQNDLKILKDKLGYRDDDHGSLPTSATPLTPAGVGALAGSGVITTQSFADGFDADYFSFTTTGGDVKFNVSPAQFSGMLDVTASIRTAGGLLIARSDTSALAETVSASNLAPGSYRLIVEGGGNYNDIGQYTVAGVLDESQDNTMRTAIRVGGDLIERPFTGWRSFNNFIGPNDADDFYRFVTEEPPSVFTAHLYGLAADATLRLIRDYDNDGLIDAGETIATSAQAGTVDELIANVPLAAGTVYYVRVARVSGQTNYVLNLFTDYARNSLPSARPTGTPAGWTGRGAVPAGPLCGEFVATDFVDAGDRDDFYRVRLDTAAVLDVALTGMSGDADLSLVHDTNGNGVIDLGELVESSANTGSGAEAINDFAAGTRGGDYFVRVRAKAGAFTNYSLRILVDYAGQTPASARALGALTGASELCDFVGAADAVDFYSFQASAGTLKVLQADGGHTLDLVRDFNGNGLIDVRETLATDENISATLSADATYYLRVRRTSGEFPSNLNYTLKFVADPGGAGDSPGAPKPLPPLQVTPLVVSDYVARWPTADASDDPNDYFRFTLDATRRVVLALDGMTGDANLRLIHDSDADGVVDPGEILATSVGRGSVPESIVRTLGSGQYLVQVVAATIEAEQRLRAGPSAPEAALRPDGSVTNYRLTLRALAPAVAGRYPFYNNSAFDGNTPAADARDDAAIATDKRPLLPGQAASFANVTSYSRGINGIMIDTTAFAAEPSAADFLFRAGNSADPATWAEVSAPVTLSRRPGAGAGGSDRITLVWPDGAILNTWLQVTVRATANTGLPSPDVFYVGNLVADTGAGNASFRVNVLDLAAVRRATRPIAAVTSRQDLNRDGRVSPLDLAIVRSAQNRLLATLTAPVAAELKSPQLGNGILGKEDEESYLLNSNA